MLANMNLNATTASNKPNNIVESMPTTNIANVPGMENVSVPGMESTPSTTSANMPSSTSEPMEEKDIVSKFLDFAAMFPKIGEMDPEIMPFIKSAFRKQNNFDPSIGFQRDLFVSSDNFADFCKANANTSGEIIVNLNDSKYSEFLAEYEKLKNLYIAKSRDLLVLLENKLLVKKTEVASGDAEVSSSTTIGNYGVAKINYSDLTILETDIRNILVDFYTKAHTYYQAAVADLYRALTEVPVEAPPAL
jgi:hypothetical protein